MEDKKLNEKESLELITQMIQNTRRNLDTGNSRYRVFTDISFDA